MGRVGLREENFSTHRDLSFLMLIPIKKPNLTSQTLIVSYWGVRARQEEIGFYIIQFLSPNEL